MRLNTSDYVPLQELLNSIPEIGLELNRNTLTIIGNLFAKGGVVPKDYKEVVYILQLLEEWYDIIKIEHDSGKHYIRIPNGQQNS